MERKTEDMQREGVGGWEKERELEREIERECV